MRNGCIGIFLLLSVSIGAGCAAGRCPAVRYADAHAALRQHAGLRHPIRSLRAESRVDQRDRQGRIRGTVMMFVERPAKVRLDAVTQFGPAAVLTSDGERVAYADLKEKRFMFGDACPANVARLIGMRMTTEQLTQLLFGEVPQLEANSSNVTCVGGGVYRITRFGVDGTMQEIDLSVRQDDLKAPLSRQRLRLTRIELFDTHGQTQWRVTYDDYRVVALQGKTQGVAMPFRVHFVDPRRGSDTLIRFKDIDINVDVPSGVFTQTPPPGTQVRRLVCEAAE